MSIKFKLELLRSGDVVDDMLLVEDDDLINPATFTRPSFMNTINEVKIQYAQRFIARKSTDDTWYPDVDGILASQIQLLIDTPGNDIDSEEDLPMGFDIKEAMVQADDLANKRIVENTHCRSIRLMMFTCTENAQWAADRYITYMSYPLATLTFIANRNLFRLQVGDNFRWRNSRLQLKEMVFRIVGIGEENLEKETIEVTAVEDIEYISNTVMWNQNIPTGSGASESRWSIQKLNDVVLFEAPYVIAGNEIQLIPIARKYTGKEQGFQIYMSYTGESYSLLDTIKTLYVMGTLTEEYPSTTYELDDTIGFKAYIPDFASQLTDITEVELFGPTNLSILSPVNGSEPEIITWQTITALGDDVYEFIGVYRNRWGSPRKNHDIGTKFFFLSTYYNVLNDENFTYGNTVYFKLVPFSGPLIGSLSEATIHSITFEGLSRRPYDPVNFGCNGVYVNPVYTSDCTMTWSPRVRGDGLGLGNPDYVVENPSHEGLFQIKVFVNDVLVRTISGIDDDEWIYTSSANLTDNGGALADIITFALRNYLTYDDIEYSSDWVYVTVTKE